MKKLVFAFALLALLPMPAPAMAKELTNVSVCGPDACYRPESLLSSYNDRLSNRIRTI